MSNNVKEAFKKHFEQHQLSSEQLAKLNALTDNRNTIKNHQPWLVKNRWMLGCVVILMTAVVFHYNQPQQSIPALIAQEVAKNHIKMRPLEIKSQSMDAMQRYFTELDFIPANSMQFELPNANLVGGRYCSILGITAAQLRYKDNNDHWATLYETQYDPNVFPALPQAEKGEQPLKQFHRGLEIEIWTEKGLLMVSAKTAPP